MWSKKADGSSVLNTSPDGDGQFPADLTVACDGRWSTVRQSTNLPSKEFPVGFDVWWYRLPTTKKTAGSLLPRMKNGDAAIAIPREGYLQVAHIGRKGTDDALRAKGIEAFRAQVLALLPEFADSVKSLQSMDNIKHLDVRLDRLRRWHGSGCSASEMPPTQCPRWAESASTSQSRTQSLQHAYWQSR